MFSGSLVSKSVKMLKRYAICGMSDDQLIGDYQGVHLVATTSLSEEKQRELSEKNPNIQHYTNIDELLDKEALDLVSICSSPSPLEDIEKVNQKKIAVLAGKPLVLQCAEIGRLAEMNQKAPIYTMLPMLFHPCLQVIREIIESGEIGEIVQLYGEKSYVEKGDDFFRSRMANLISCLQWGFAIGLGKPHLLSCAANRIGKHMSEYAMSIQLKYDSQAIQSIVLNSHKPEGHDHWCGERVRIWGTEGVIESIGLTSIKVVSKNGDVREEIGFLQGAETAFPQELFDSLNRGVPCLLTPEIGFWSSELALEIGEQLK